MDNNRRENFETTIERWQSRIDALVKDLKGRAGPRGGLREHLRSELGVYGLCLAHVRSQLETELGIQNATRERAGKAYSLAMDKVSELYQESEEHGHVGSVTAWPTMIQTSWEDRMEKAQLAKSQAILSYSAE